MDLNPPITILLLPGLDGTGTLFDVFCRHCPPGFETRVISYPPDRCLGYRELIEQVRSQLPRDNPFILLGESFSGPLSIRLAAENPPGLMALVLSATFAAPPRTPWLFRLPWSLIFRLPTPSWLIRRILAGNRPDPDLIAKIYAITRSVQPTVLAHRVREVARTDVMRELQNCRVPILCLQAAQDRLLSPDTADIIRRHAPHAVIARVSAPHMLLQSAPEESWRQIVQFLDMNGVASFRAIRAWVSGRKVWIELEDGREVGFPAEKFPRLRNAPDDLLALVRIEARGTALRWEELDEDISVNGILAGRFGPRL